MENKTKEPVHSKSNSARSGCIFKRVTTPAKDPKQASKAAAAAASAAAAAEAAGKKFGKSCFSIVFSMNPRPKPV